ncbi:hypothetical protein GCM10027048_14080 [Hymenobacter coalescens]
MAASKCQEPICYFKLDETMFAEQVAGPMPVFPDLTIEEIHLRDDEYLDASTNLAGVDPFRQDTTILNFQVGTGKTKVLFDYIEQYQNAEQEYTIFYCAPFLRLLGELSGELRRRGIIYFDCTRITGGEDASSATPDNFNRSVQLMTPDFLLGSGGKKSARQSTGKADYKMELLKHLRAVHRRVVLIIDEVHERPQVFASAYLPHLLAWRGLVHKAFIASATFSYDSVAVAKAVAHLTGRKIAVYQADRQKRATQARLHLHLCAHPYSEKELEPLAGLAEVVGRYPERRVHVLTAYKSMAKKLHSGQGGPVASALKSRLPVPTLLTGESSAAFHESRNTIGTTFKTGVNITRTDGVLIIVLPGAATDGTMETRLGTFTDMRSAVVQAFARLRNGGDIHVFMPPFKHYIDNANPGLNLLCSMTLNRLVGGGAQNADTYATERELLQDFTELHEERLKLLEGFRADPSVDATTQASYERYIGFETLYDFLVTEYPSHKDAALEARGQELPALILWMALHEQFSNCSLESITVERYTPPTTVLPAADKMSAFIEDAIKHRRDQYHPTTLFDGIEAVLQLLDEKPDGGNGRLFVYRTPLLSKSERLTIGELFERFPAVAEKVTEVAENWVHPGRIQQKRLRFGQHVTEAKDWDWSAPKSREDYYSRVQHALGSAVREVLELAKELGSSLYLPANFEDHLPQESQLILAHLVSALRAVESHDPNLGSTWLYFPRDSKMPAANRKSEPAQPSKPREDAEYWSIAVALVRQQLGLVNKQPSKRGRENLFGVDTLHIKLDPAVVASVR